MMVARKILSALSVLLFLTGSGWIGIRSVEERASSVALSAHQMRWDCWRERTAMIPECVRVVKPGADDAGACLAAVSACRADGVDAAVDAAEKCLQRWVALSAILMLAAIAESAALLGIGAFVLLSRRRKD
jgi:hypothetical protein